MRSSATLLPLLVLLASHPSARAQQASDPIPAEPKTAVQALPAQTLAMDTPITVAIYQRVPLRVGQALTARSVYPIYSAGMLAIPAGAIVNGTVIALEPNQKRRVRSRFSGDFTPYSTPVVRFTSIVIPGGVVLPVESSRATAGAPLIRLKPTATAKGGFVSTQFAVFRQNARDQVASFAAPDKKDRFLQGLYAELPYHPQRIASNTAWTFDLTAPLQLEARSVTAPVLGSVLAASADHTSQESANTIKLEATLDEALSSSTTPNGTIIHATVAVPVLNSDGSVAIPQGSKLTGVVSVVRPARSFSRDGALRFDFNKLTLPGEESQAVQSVMTGTDANTDAGLALSTEGEAKPKPRDKVVAPLLLLAFAGRSLHEEDGGVGEKFGKDTTGANGIGLIGNLVGAAAQTPAFAAGIGFYGAAGSIYDRWIARGKEVDFARDARIFVSSTVRHSAPLKVEADTAAPAKPPVISASR